MEETKSQVAVTAPAAEAATTTPIADMSVPLILSRLPNVSPGHASLPRSSASEKLVNGLAEMPIIPVFESIPVERVNNHMDTPPVPTPIVNNVDAMAKSDVKSERTDIAKNECSRIPVNDCVENNARVVDSATEERLTNHVEENITLNIILTRNSFQQLYQCANFLIIQCVLVSSLQIAFVYNVY
jgi:hypothetical protein